MNDRQPTDLARVRGWAMVWAGLLWILVSTGFVEGLAASGTPRPDLFHTHFPVPVRIALWGIPGAVACVTAFTRWSTAGLALLWIPPAIRAMSYLWAWIVWLFPGPPDGQANGWYSSLFYLGLAALPLILAYLPGRGRRSDR